MPRKTLHYALAALPRESLLDGLWERTAIRGDDSLITINWMRPGIERMPLHSHPFDQVSFVIHGKMAFEIEGEFFTVSAGEVVQIPAGAEHTAVVVDDEVVLNIDVFAPVREDYLHLVGYQKDEFADAEVNR